MPIAVLCLNRKCRLEMSNLPLRFNDKFYENAVISKNGNIFRRSVMCKKVRRLVPIFHTFNGLKIQGGG